MKTRRQSIKLILGLLSGVGLLYSPLAKGIRVVFAKAKKMILPKGTHMDTLVGKNPANLDTRHLDLTSLEEFGTMGLDDYRVDLS